jgi:hypothetical protein
MNAADGTARFTPLDADGEPDGAPVVVPVSSMKVVNVEPIFDIDGGWGPLWQGERLHSQMSDLSGALAAVGYATINNITPAFADLFDALAFIGTGTRRRRSRKAERASAKRAKLAQRRAARVLPREPGDDWREAAPMLRMSIGAIVREGVPCAPVPCPPYKYTRMAADAIAVLTEEDS